MVLPPTSYMALFKVLICIFSSLIIQWGSMDGSSSYLLHDLIQGFLFNLIIQWGSIDGSSSYLLHDLLQGFDST